MISAIRLQSSNYDDDNFAAIFVRKRQENYLELTEKARSEIAKVLYFLDLVRSE